MGRPGHMNELWVIAQRNPNVIGGIDVLEDAVDFQSALDRADELDPNYRKRIYATTRADVDHVRADAMGASRGSP